MSSNERETTPNNLESAIDQLIKGRELATQLRVLLQDKVHYSVTTNLTRGLTDAFSNAIAALKPRSNKINHKSSKKGGYRRRSNPYSCAKKTTSTLEDGRSWRKYGQKEIHNAKFLRSYYRCTHKFDQGCAATRQVQRSEEDPSLFVITYFGEHTCKDPAELFSCYQHIQRDSYILDFASYAKPELSIVKQERVEEIVSNDPTPGNSSSELCFELPELGDVTSGLMQPPSDDLGWDFLEQSFDDEFSEFLGFEMMDF